MTNFVTIVGISTSSISNHTKHIDLPSSTKYRLFNKGNVKKINRLRWWYELVIIEKSIKSYPNFNYDLMIKVQDWILKHPIVVASPITNDTLLVKNIESGKIFYFLLYLVLSYY